MVTDFWMTFDSVRNDLVPAAIAPDEAVDGTPTVFVIDGDVAVRKSLELLIRTKGRGSESFASAEQFLAHPRGAVPCCAIVDHTLPTLNGLELAKRLAGGLEIPMIFVSGHADIETTVQAMKAGAIEFLTKPLRRDRLMAAINDALERSRTTLRLRYEMRMLTERYESLSSRQREVMALVASGLLNKQVGFELGISEPTVKAHRGQVMLKMNAESLVDLVTMAIRLRLLPAAKH
jgi:FixJ family two-component response regulator